MKKFTTLCLLFVSCFSILNVNAVVPKDPVVYILTSADVTIDASGYITDCSYDFSNTIILLKACFGIANYLKTWD